MKINHGSEQISSCSHCRVKAADLFEAGLSDKARTDLAQMTQSRTYSPGEILIAEGSAPKGVFLIDAGRVKLVRRADERPEVVKIARAAMSSVWVSRSPMRCIASRRKSSLTPRFASSPRPNSTDSIGRCSSAIRRRHRILPAGIEILAV